MEGLGFIRDCGPFRRTVLKDYCKRMSSPNEEPIYDEVVAQYLYETGIRWENVPRSLYDPAQLYEALGRYGQTAECEDNLYLQQAERIAFKIFGKPESHEYLDVLNDDEIVAYAVHLNKSAGLPSMKKKRDDLPYAFDRSYQILHGDKAPNPCVAYARTSSNNKTRLVRGYPFEMTILEARYAKPLINKFIERYSPIVYGLYKFETGALIQNRVINQGIPHCLDYSKFDSTIPAVLIRKAFKILRSWFRPEDTQGWGWDNIISYFVNTPIVMPDGHIYKGKKHGVPSGSFFTNLADSIVNTMVIFASLKEMGHDLHWRNIFVMGDDSIFPLDCVIDTEVLAQKLAKYNIKLNIEKTVIGKAHFIGATWIYAQPHKKISELACKAVNPESRRQCSKFGPLIDAKQVIYSYASAYVEMYYAIKQSNFIFGESLNRIEESGGKDAKLSGSDYFHTQFELRDRDDGVERAYYSTIGMRLLF